MIDRILLPLDGSSEAEAAIPYAIALARTFHSDVILLRVVERSPHPGTDWTDPVDWRLARTEAMQYLEEVKPRFHDTARSVDLDVGTGPPAEEILETARTRRVDLIALTTHGEGGVSEFPLAGTAHKVACTAEVSLLVIPTARPIAAGAVRPVLVPLDGSQRAEWALRLATTLAGSEGATLVALHVVRVPEVLAVEGSDEVQRLAEAYVRASTATARRYLDATLARLAASDLPHRTRVCQGASVPRAIEEVAGEEGVSLVVLSAHGVTAAEACPYGTVAGGFLSRARYPVLVLQDRPSTGPGRRGRWSAARSDRTDRAPQTSRSGNRT